jgi:hypothetical protein
MVGDALSLILFLEIKQANLGVKMPRWAGTAVGICAILGIILLVIVLVSRVR